MLGKLFRLASRYRPSANQGLPDRQFIGRVIGDWPEASPIWWNGASRPFGRASTGRPVWVAVEKCTTLGYPGPTLARAIPVGPNALHFMLRAFGPTRMCHHRDTGGTRLIAKVVPNAVVTDTPVPRSSLSEMVMASNLVLGGIAIAERHVAKWMSTIGCSPSRTRAVVLHHTVSLRCRLTKSLLSDYALSLRTSGRSPIPVVLTFSPCGSVRTLEIMKWLGISFPLARKRTPPFGRHAGASSTCARGYSPMCRTMPAKSLANRHQRRERLHSEVGDRRVSRAISAISLTSRTVRRCSLPNQALQQTRLAQRNEVPE